MGGNTQYLSKHIPALALEISRCNGLMMIRRIDSICSRSEARQTAAIRLKTRVRRTVHVAEWMSSCPAKRSLSLQC